MNIFEKATRNKYRFNSVKGALSVEQLWDLPLTASGRNEGFDLDTVAKTVHSELKGMEEESFVATRSNPEKGHTEARLELVKHIIAYKIKLKEEAENRRERESKRRILMDVLANKEEQKLANMSEDEIRKQLAELA